jgi:2-keto-4-pentenoate hydratase
MSNLQKAADALHEAAKTRKPCAPVRDLIGDGGVEAAYRVQEINTRRWLAEGRRPVGRKIGLTSKSVQKQLGVDQPDYGMLYADMDVPEGKDIPVERLMQPKVEAEIAFVLERDLATEQLTTADMISGIAYAVPAIEIVESRVADWDIRITDTIADNASSGLFVLGNSPRRFGEFDMRLCGMVMEKYGEPVSTGAGIACLGSPLSAALWLARVMVENGHPLRAGDVILSGALGPMAPIASGDVVEARIQGLGSVRAGFS